MNRSVLYEEYRLIERSEVNINRAWKGAHLLLFFLTFVFGSFCTFCFHMLMYLFDEKCVLFPKLLSLTSQRHNVIYEFMPSNKDLTDMPVDFLSTQWVEKSTCSLPTYVPLVSGIFGLVWTTIFLMCSTGTRTLTGYLLFIYTVDRWLLELQRPWRVLPPVFIFSVAMSILCIYSSAVTHSGLQELCVKLGEITGSSTCSYAVNVVTLVYERRIRGVYQATRLTIVSAWLHTTCWILSALLAVARVVLAVDFQLVRIKVTLHADIDKLMERNETHLRTISPDEGRMKDKYTATNDNEEPSDKLNVILNKASENDTVFLDSRLSLVPEEKEKIAKREASRKISEDKQFIVEMLYDILDDKNLPAGGGNMPLLRTTSSPFSNDDQNANFVSKVLNSFNILSETLPDIETFIKDIIRGIIDSLEDLVMGVHLTYPQQFMLSDNESFITEPDYLQNEQGINSSKDETDLFEEKKKSNLKNASSQTDNEKKGKQKRVSISEKSSYQSENVTSESDEDQRSQDRESNFDKATQSSEKEKQD